MGATIAWTRSNAIALLALFVALGGTGYAATSINGKLIKSNTVTGKKLKKDTLGAREIKESKLAKVPRATRADVAGVAERAASANTATSAGTARRADTAASATTAATATSAANATDAGMLDGVDSTGFLRSTPPEAYREVGTAGQPGFGAGWTNAGASDTTAAFFKDPFGIVHLKGAVARVAGASLIYTLPAGYTPTKNACFPTVNAAVNPPTPAHICIAASGAVQQITGPASGFYLLDGVTFRAGAG